VTPFWRLVIGCPLYGTGPGEGTPKFIVYTCLKADKPNLKQTHTTLGGLNLQLKPSGAAVGFYLKLLQYTLKHHFSTFCMNLYEICRCFQRNRFFVDAAYIYDVFPQFESKSSRSTLTSHSGVRVKVTHVVFNAYP
jgi:hypothetical protein